MRSLLAAQSIAALWQRSHKAISHLSVLVAFQVVSLQVQDHSVQVPESQLDRAAEQRVFPIGDLGVDGRPILGGHDLQDSREEMFILPGHVAAIHIDELAGHAGKPLLRDCAGIQDLIDRSPREAACEEAQVLVLVK